MMHRHSTPEKIRRPHMVGVASILLRSNIVHSATNPLRKCMQRSFYLQVSHYERTYSTTPYLLLDYDYHFAIEILSVKYAARQHEMTTTTTIGKSDADLGLRPHSVIRPIGRIVPRIRSWIDVVNHDCLTFAVINSLAFTVCSLYSGLWK
jgi:hypothetical protein